MNRSIGEGCPPARTVRSMPSRSDRTAKPRSSRSCFISGGMNHARCGSPVRAMKAAVRSFRLRRGSLYVASRRLPTAEREAIASIDDSTSARVRYEITPSNTHAVGTSVEWPARARVGASGSRERSTAT